MTGYEGWLIGDNHGGIFEQYRDLEIRIWLNWVTAGRVRDLDLDAVTCRDSLALTETPAVDADASVRDQFGGGAARWRMPEPHEVAVQSFAVPSSPAS